MAKRHPQHGDERINEKAGGQGDASPPGTSEKDMSQTRMPQEQDPERRLGNFVGKGEAPIKQPGGRRG